MENKRKDQRGQVWFALLILENFVFPLKIMLVVKKMFSVSS